MISTMIDVRGRLVIRADTDGVEELTEREGYRRREKDVVEAITGNGLEWLQPEEIGALTSAPIIADDVQHDDDGKVIDVGRVWWFPNYQIEDFTETLIRDGMVTFDLAAHDD